MTAGESLEYEDDLKPLFVLSSRGQTSRGMLNGQLGKNPAKYNNFHSWSNRYIIGVNKMALRMAHLQRTRITHGND
ncbi:MAG: hypothetical protein E3J86_14920 [Candidatus Thorarchaeota archaeon]|nr:MAG: hypothetical protein E3J86_14920 [Candidatus Thorarchaeota archaeon]